MINRHEWVKAVNASGVLLRAKSIAFALWSFCNDETGLINPSLPSLCEASGMLEDTARRALADLEKAGWLARTVGRGQGVRSVYVLLSPGNVVAIRPVNPTRQKADKADDKVARTADIKSHGRGVNGKTKGGTEAAIRLQRCKPHIRKEQSFEQKGGASERPRADLQVPMHPTSEMAGEWGEWLHRRGLPPLAALTKLHRGGEYVLPYRRPPRDSDETLLRITLSVIEWAKGARDADAA